VLGVLSHEREEHVGLLPEHVTVEDPAVGEAVALGQRARLDRALERDIRLQREPNSMRDGSLEARPAVLQHRALDLRQLVAVHVELSAPDRLERRSW